MTTQPENRCSTLLADLAVTASLASLIAGLCIALAWIAPLEIVLPRLR